MSGGGIGSMIGTGLGIALAPETGGLSMMIPALAGAAGGYLGGAATGSKNPVMDAFMGGIGGGLGGASGLGDSLGLSNAAGLWGDSAANAATSGLGDAMSVMGSTAGPIGQAAPIPSVGSNLSNATTIASQAAPQAAEAAPTSMLGNLGNWASKNPLQTAILGNMGASAVQSFMPHPQVNVAQNRANVMNSDPSFSGALPPYHMQNTATPYTGDWNTYGMSPQKPMYQSQAMPGYAKGGVVKMAMGGTPPMMAPQMPPSPPMGQPPMNPLMAMKAAHTIGMAIGKKLRAGSPLTDHHGMVHGKGGGQDDLVPARLSQNEYVVPADVTAHLGDGSSNAGGKALDHLVKKVRAHKAVKGFPPKSRNPLSYLPKGSI